MAGLKLGLASAVIMCCCVLQRSAAFHAVSPIHLGEQQQTLGRGHVDTMFLAARPLLQRPGLRATTKTSILCMAAKKKKVGGRKKAAAAAEAGSLLLEEQLKKNVELHIKECNDMLQNFDARLPADATRQTFGPSDFKRFSVGETLLGENLNGPFKATDLIQHTTAPLFSKEECEAVIAEAEAHASASGGWGTQRHYSHPTTDVLLSELPSSLAWFQRALPTKVFPLVADAFPHVIKDAEKLRIFDVFVVKYEAERQAYLSVHRDSSLISLTIALNPQTDFDGGGMWVEPLDKVVSLDQGQAVTFASNIRHGGHRITSGQRYILVGFLLYEDEVEHDRRLLQTSQALRAAGSAWEAEEVCRLAVQLNPRRQEAWNNLGVLQRDRGAFDAALKSFGQALEIEPSYQEGWVNLGVCQGLAGELHEAVATAHKAVKLNNGDATAHYNLACAQAHLGESAAALSSLHRALELNPDDAEALHRRGQLRLETASEAVDSDASGQGEAGLAAAVADLQRAAKLMPKSAAVRNDLGVALYEGGRLEEALDAFEAAAGLDAKDEQARSNAMQLRQYLASVRG